MVKFTFWIAAQVFEIAAQLEIWPPRALDPTFRFCCIGLRSCCCAAFVQMGGGDIEN